jgi:putative heme-binding domain-containing protein
MHRLFLAGLGLCLNTAATLAALNGPVWLEDRFELPEGFHIYRAATAALSGGSYALAFDGEGRLLVGDGTAVRRLSDDDHDGVYDRFEVIATGLGPRGPQGLLVLDDTLYAIGGDGLQRFTGYRSGGPLQHPGRLGPTLRTGGDHDAHTLLRGHDGWIYLMAGNGSGLTNRLHITEGTSPALFEREASVFRISPDGARWECLASGGRNPPSLGLNYLGDWFSFDSDMEWHVGLPWYRPVRLNHWAIGADQGWQEVGAFPPYFIDNLPGILDVGRGSPTWGTFYEHHQWPEKYQNAFLVCDYRWKRESNDQYATTGRLVAFFLRRQGSGWTATMETVARPRPEARDAEGKPINFALVDAVVAPDGSLLLSDHTQGIWRVCHLPAAGKPGSSAPAITPEWPDVPRTPDAILDALLSLDQPGSERTRLREAVLRQALGNEADRQLQRAALSERPLPQRLRAIRLLAPGFAAWPGDFVQSLARDRAEEVRAQAAWIFGLRGRDDDARGLQGLLGDEAPLVRRRAAEGLSRLGAPAATPGLIDRLNDPDRLVRSVAMHALAHRPSAEWFEQTATAPTLQTRLRGLVAAHYRRDLPAESQVQRAIASILDQPVTSTEDQLDVLRILGMFRPTIESEAALRERVQSGLLARFPSPEREVRWEQIRLLGEYQVKPAFPALLGALEKETDPVTQFHLAQALADLPAGWSLEEEKRAVAWFLGTQRGWFSEFAGKGVQFPEFWSTVLSEFGQHHRNALILETPRIDLASLLGGALIEQIARSSTTGLELVSMYQLSEKHEARLRILRALRGLRTPEVAEFFLNEHEQLDPDTAEGAAINSVILLYWAERPDSVTLPFLVYEGLFHDDARVVRTVVTALLQDKTALRTLLTADAISPARRGAVAQATQADLATDLITRMMERRDLQMALENILVVWSGRQRPDFKPGTDLQRKPDEADRAAAAKFWQEWFVRQFARKFEPAQDKAAPEKSDADIQRFLLGNESRGGDARRGVAVYETLQCQSCHGGGVTPGKEGRLFGPDLAGVTRRLNRLELADSLVYPSKQIADRFKATALTLKDGTVLSGFLTEQTAENLTLAEQGQVRRLSRKEVQSVAPLTVSLMPERLLNRLSFEEIRDLLAFLENGPPR